MKSNFRSQLPTPQVVRRIPDGPHTLTVELTYDRRLSRTVRANLKHETIYVRAPVAIPPDELERLLDQIVEKILKRRAKARQRNDAELEARAQALNQRYFGGELHWHTIRWVNDMRHRLGSCTDGGITDGDIRISNRLRNWPNYVIDYVIAHELVHRKYPHHDAEFWAYLARYPHTERARGFIEGIRFAQGEDPDGLS